MPKQFRFEKFDNKELSDLQRNVQEYTAQFNKPILDGVLIEGIDLVFGQTTTVNHGLGRKVRGFEIAYKNNSVDVWAEDSLQTIPTRTLELSTSADATISLWVY